MLMIPPEEPQYDEYGRPIKPVVAPVMQAPQQPINPNFSPIPIQPSPATPAESQLSNLQLPERSQFHNSKLRTVLNAIAGGLAGASGGAKVGLTTGQELRDQPYNRAMEDYGTKVARLKTLRESEKEQVGRSEKEIELGVRRGTGEATADYKGRTADINQEKADTQKQNITSLEERRKNLTTQGQQRLDQLPPRLREAVDFSKMDEAEQKAVSDAILAIHPITKDTIEESGLREAEKTKARLGEQDTDLGRRVIGSQAGIRTEASEKAKVAVNATPEAAASAANIAGAKSDAQLTGNQKQTRTGAQEILAQYPRINANIDKALKSGKMDSTISSRWNEFMTGHLGTNDPTMVAIRTDLGFLQSKLSQIHTTRTSNEVLQKFQELMNAKTMTAGTLKDALSTVKHWVDEYAKDPRKVEEEYEKNHPNDATASPSKYNIRINK